MYKKLITACLAVTALAALIGPATASAENSPMLKDGEPKTALAVGAKVVGTNIGNTVFTNTSGEAVITCQTALMTGSVHRNEGGTVEGTITTADFWGHGAVHPHNNTGECEGGGGTAVTVVGSLCIRSTPAMATHEFQVHGGACTGAQNNVKFSLYTTLAGHCEYETTNVVKGDYLTSPSNELKVRNTEAGSGAKKITGNFLCPSSGMLKMSFSLETHDKTPITID